MRFLNLGTTHRNFLMLAQRSVSILDRYGLSANKMESNVSHYLRIMQQHGITPTFSIPAKVLDRHAEIVQSFQDSGVEFAVHGYKHIDFTRLSRGEILEHMEKAVKVFQRNNIQFSGFRFPYLKWNPKCIEALGNCSFEWDSSHTILWDVVDTILLSERDIRNYQHMLDQYHCTSSSNCVSLPKLRNNVLEIPVSLPDDDLLERLGLTNSEAVEGVWSEILSQTHARGELFTLQLHPERIRLYQDALTSIIETAKRLSPSVWVSSLDDICEWWREKDAFSVEVNKTGDDEYEICVNCSPRASFLVRSTYLGESKFYNGHELIKGKALRIKSQKRPIVGISKGSPQALLGFLKNEGFIFEMSEEREKYSVYIDGFPDFSEKDEIRALESIHSCRSPFVRLRRWPDGCESALCITGDIDALSSIDFFLRPLGLS